MPSVSHLPSVSMPAAPAGAMICRTALPLSAGPARPGRLPAARRIGRSDAGVRRRVGGGPAVRGRHGGGEEAFLPELAPALDGVARLTVDVGRVRGDTLARETRGPRNDTALRGRQ